jgi:hypothetical protein
MDSDILLLLGGFLLVVLVLLFIRQQGNGGAQFLNKDLFVSKELHTATVEQHEKLRAEMADKEDDLRSALAQLAAREQQIFHLEQTLLTHRKQKSSNFRHASKQNLRISPIACWKRSQNDSPSKMPGIYSLF